MGLHNGITEIGLHLSVQTGLTNWTNVALFLVKLDVSAVKFIYSEKATKFCEISTVDLS